MNNETIEKLLIEKVNFDKVFYKVGRFVAVVNNIDYSNFETKLNEVATAYLWSMDIWEVSDLEVEESSFKCFVKVLGNIELEERASGEIIEDSVEVNFGLTISGIINNDEVVINYVEGIKVI